MSLRVVDWLASTHRPACLDVRPESEFSHAHLPGAGNVPLSELEARIHELPRRGEELFVVGEGAERAAGLLASRGRWRLDWSEEPVGGWPAEALVAGAGAPLWSPNLWLKEHWRRIPSRGRVVDLAMGSGRNAVYLALKGYRVEGEDILPEAVEFARRLAQRHGVEIAARVGDLTRPDPLPAGVFDGLLVFNYLDRALMPGLARALAPGGVLLYETFTEAQAHSGGKPRNPQWLLKPMELHDAFAGELEILAYREGRPDLDRHVASLLARRHR